MIEWTVACWRDVAWYEHQQKPVTTYIVTLPKAHDLSHVSKIILSGLLRDAQRLGICDMTIVLVHVFCDKVQIPLYKTLTPFLHEFHSGRFGVLCVGHLERSES